MRPITAYVTAAELPASPSATSIWTCMYSTSSATCASIISTDKQETSNFELQISIEIFDPKSHHPTDLDAPKCHGKQIFRETAAQPQTPTHIKEETDGRISQTIVRIQSNQPKRAENDGFSNRQSRTQMAHRDYLGPPGNWPGEGAKHSLFQISGS